MKHSEREQTALTTALQPKCRHCSSPLTLQMIDLGACPPSNALNLSQDCKEQHYPLRVLVCTDCWLAQTDISLFKLDHDELFTKDYPYYSSTSKSWVEHAKKFVEMASDRFMLDMRHLTVEVGSNDGYLLQFVKTRCYGVEPTQTGEKAKEKGIAVYPLFFGSEFAEKQAEKADLMVCNNVLAHVPDINDFVKGFSILLKDSGVATFEFPHLLNLVQKGQFDTIYHEHYSYLSLTAVKRIFESQGLTVFDVEELPTHGGSLRIYASKGFYAPLPSVVAMLEKEGKAGMWTAEFYSDFQKAADKIKNDFMGFLLDAKSMGLKVAGFGAAAKGNTLLNYAGVRSDLLPYVVDNTIAKQGKFLPGSRIPVLPSFPERPDYVVILAWNFKEEIIGKLERLRREGSKFVTVIPRLEIC